LLRVTELELVGVLAGLVLENNLVENFTIEVFWHHLLVNANKLNYIFLGHPFHKSLIGALQDCLLVLIFKIKQASLQVLNLLCCLIAPLPIS